ncbi:MAG: hypothetical protein PVH61_13905 [Candidatus Aminicenantes bacterium]|jgi:hypothetical protein
MLDEWNLLQVAIKEYAKCGNLSQVLVTLNVDGFPDLTYNRLYRRYKKYQNDFETAAKEYQKKVVEKAELDIDLEIEIFGSLVRMFKKINSILDNIPSDQVEDINAISQLNHSLTGLSKEISRLKDVQEKRLEWKLIKDNEVIEFFLQDTDIKPLIVKKKNALTQYLKKKRYKK